MSKKLIIIFHEFFTYYYNVSYFLIMFVDCTFSNDRIFLISFLPTCLTMKFSLLFYFAIVYCVGLKNFLYPIYKFFLFICFRSDSNIILLPFCFEEQHKLLDLVNCLNFG